MLKKIISIVGLISIFLIFVSCKNIDTPSNIATSIETSSYDTNVSMNTGIEDSSTNNTTLDKSTVTAEISDNSASIKTSESTKVEIQKDNTQGSSYISKDVLLSLFKLKKDDILIKLGNTYKLVPAGAEGSYDGYWYKELGITIAFDADDSIAFIDCDKNVNIDGARAGMNFRQIQEKLGKSEVKETWIETPENKAYEITYTKDNCTISFVSAEKDGTDCNLSLY